MFYVLFCCQVHGDGFCIGWFGLIGLIEREGEIVCNGWGTVERELDSMDSFLGGVCIKRMCLCYYVS